MPPARGTGVETNPRNEYRAITRARSAHKGARAIIAGIPEITSFRNAQPQAIAFAGLSVIQTPLFSFLFEPQEPISMAGLDSHHSSEPDRSESAGTIARNSFYGGVLFLIYLLLYGSFVYMTAFQFEWMSRKLWGANVAIVF